MRSLIVSTVLLAVVHCCNAAKYTFETSSTGPFRITAKSGQKIITTNSALQSGRTNTTLSPLSSSAQNSTIKTDQISSSILKVHISSPSPFIGATFTDDASTLYYGTWEYPFEGLLTNNNITFDLKGVGNAQGINWCNARAPFFFSSAGYGVYTDTLAMGSYDFSTPGKVSFVFNSSELTYYIILPAEDEDGDDGGIKSILSQYITTLSEPITLPPISGLGPTFWSDNFEQDFAPGVTNAQENYYDVISHLYTNQIRATSMFADRPYGTGNMSFGNFDFDPVFYPSPREFIANLSSWGFDFQVWVANRAFENTRLYNYSRERGWLFDGHASQGGPALNLSIPEAYEYFRGELLEAFPKLGVRGYKIDRGEEEEMPVFEQNVQMTLFEQLCSESMEAVWGNSTGTSSGGGFYNFARSAVDRARSTTHIWNGDAHSNWTGLAYSVASGIRSGLVGFPIWGSDTGGYIRDANSPTEELWARWMWVSAFSPVYELMLGTNHTPWYAPYSAHLVDVLKKTANLHAELTPFILSKAKEAQKTGVPIMRALFLEAPEDERVWEITDEYFYGSEFLVAPVVTKGGQRSVYFPKGKMYLDYFDRTKTYAGGTTVKVSVPVDSAPVYVTEGAIVVKGDIYQGNNRWSQNWSPSLTIEVYPSSSVEESSFDFYSPVLDDTVEIKARYVKETQTIEVSYGELGYPGDIVIYTKAGEQRQKLVSGGGQGRMTAIESVF